MHGNGVNIARNVRALERLKAEMLDALAALIKSLVTNGTQGAAARLARLIVCSFLLAKRLGLSFGQLEEQVYAETAQLSDEAAKKANEAGGADWLDDIALFKEYMDMKR